MNQLKRNAILKAIRVLKQRHKGNRKYSIHPQDVVSELTRARCSYYWADMYDGVKCTRKEVEEVMKGE